MMGDREGLVRGWVGVGGGSNFLVCCSAAQTAPGTLSKMEMCAICLVYRSQHWPASARGWGGAADILRCQRFHSRWGEKKKQEKVARIFHSPFPQESGVDENNHPPGKQMSVPAPHPTAADRLITFIYRRHGGSES